MKKIIFYQSNFCQIGGVETMAYNWCWWLRNYFDVTVLYCTGDITRLNKMARLVKMEKYEEGKTYECDIFIRNSVWGKIPQNIKAKRMVEMRHANYKYLLEQGLLYQQYASMGIKEIVGCGEFVSKMSDEVLHDNPTTIKNILLPRQETKKVLHLVSCTRLDPAKGWKRMLKMCEMMKSAGIKFEWNIFTNSNYRCDYEEVHFWKQRYDIWDYLADADYTVLLSDSEGLPYTVQESLQYQVPCIVTDVGGCTELIKDGINGYVVPLDMNFDINKITKIPKCSEYDNHALEDWLKYLGYKGKIDKQRIIDDFKEEKKVMVKVRVIQEFTLQAFSEARNLKRIDSKKNEEGRLYVGDTFECTDAFSEYLTGKNQNGLIVVEIIDTVEEEPKVEKKEEPKAFLEKTTKNVKKKTSKK